MNNRTLKIGRKVEGRNKVTVECDIKFNELELCQMRTCEKTTLFELRCSLYGDDPLFDDHLFDFGEVKSYPDGSPASDVHAVFETNATPNSLNEDWGTDELYGRLKLTNMLNRHELVRDTNIVSRSF